MHDDQSVLPPSKPKVQAEYGSAYPVRFIEPENVRLYDTEENVVLCKCGKPAGACAIGIKASVAWCSDCSPWNKEVVADFIYRPPSDNTTRQ